MDAVYTYPSQLPMVSTARNAECNSPFPCTSHQHRCSIDQTLNKQRLLLYERKYIREKVQYCKSVTCKKNAQRRNVIKAFNDTTLMKMTLVKELT